MDYLKPTDLIKVNMLSKDDTFALASCQISGQLFPRDPHMWSTAWFQCASKISGVFFFHVVLFDVLNRLRPAPLMRFLTFFKDHLF